MTMVPLTPTPKYEQVMSRALEVKTALRVEIAETEKSLDRFRRLVETARRDADTRRDERKK